MKIGFKPKEDGDGSNGLNGVSVVCWNCKDKLSLLLLKIRFYKEGFLQPAGDAKS